MSEDQFHVHGLHDHEMEHAAHAHADARSSRLAMVTALLATLGALFSYMGGATQANAALYKNDAAIRKTEASDQWSFYQAKSNKENLAEFAVDLVSDNRRAAYLEQIKRYQEEKATIKLKAEQLEEQAKVAEEKSEHEMHLHHRWAQATTVLQVAIALAAITLLTRKTWTEYLVFGLGALGLAMGVGAWLAV